MATTFLSTATYSNLTRLELEALRKADFYAGGKALTVGDSALPPEGVVGKGDINAEPYYTNASVLLDDVYTLTPPTTPGTGLSTLVSVGNVTSEVLKWIGPTYVTDGAEAYASAVDTITDASAAFGALVQPGDVVLLQAYNDLSASSDNQYAMGVVSVVNPTSLQFSYVNAPNNAPTTQLQVDSTTYYYTIIRPSAVQLFAVPGSGPIGQEQTFLTVIPGSTLHGTVGPTLNAINADRLRSLVLPELSGSTARDRSDAVFPAPAPGGSGLDLGYRIVLYPDDGTGTGPDLTSPITSLNPVIDPSIPATDQRLTVDYKAGIIRFSCAPALGGDIKVAGGVNATTGRLNLYAVFFTVDQSLTEGNARGLYGVRTTAQVARPAARVFYNPTTDAWHMTENPSNRDFFVQAWDSTTDTREEVRFGYYSSALAGTDKSRYFAYDSTTSKWRFKAASAPDVSDTAASMEMVIADKTALTIGDISAPPRSPADITPAVITSPRGARNTTNALTTLLQSAISSGDYGVVHLRRGKYNLSQTLHVPPGVIIEGEGDNTVIEYTPAAAAVLYDTESRPAIKFGPNAPTGVYDITYDPSSDTFSPTTIDTSVSNHIEGMDIVWNSVRRCWAIFWADATSQVIWYQEIGLNGQALFNPLQVASGRPLYTSSSKTGENWHTPGHYPRVAFHEPTDTYAVTWVADDNIGGLPGPTAFWAVIQTDLDTRNVKDSPFSPSFTYIAPISTFELPATTFFSTHPSVAASNLDSATYMFAFSYWRYEVTTAGTWEYSQAPEVTAYFYQSGGTTTSSTLANLTKNNVITSTDVSEDGRGGFLFAWSRHKHPLRYSTNGKLTYRAGATQVTTGTGFQQPLRPWPSEAAIDDFVVTTPDADQFNVGETVYLARPVLNIGTVSSISNGYTITRAAGWGNTAAGDWIVLAGDPVPHLIGSVVGTTITLRGSLTTAAGTPAYTVWPNPVNYSLADHEVSSYVVTERRTGATNSLTLQVLDFLSIPAGTVFPASTTAIFKTPHLVLEDTALGADWSDILGSDNAERYPVSKFLRLGRDIPTPISYGTKPFGVDYGVSDYSTSTPTELRVRAWPDDGTPIDLLDSYTYINTSPAYTTVTLVSGTGSTTLNGTVLTDAGANFVTDGIEPGFWLVVTGETNPFLIQTVTATTLTITGNVFKQASGAYSYQVRYGAKDEAWAIVAQSLIEGVRIDESGNLGPVFEIAGTSPTPNTQTSGATTIVELPGNTDVKYDQAHLEPDYVRLSRGDDKWLVVYQAMRTTAQLATPYTVNWADRGTSSNQLLYIGEHTAVYREHVSTCFALVEDANAGINPTVAGPSPTNVALTPFSSSFYQDVIRDVNVSNRSLGTRAPIVHRPNYYQINSASSSGGWLSIRHGQAFNNEIGCLNYMHRWTPTSTPGLIPDATWTGEDWTIVSPTKRTIESFAGVYEVSGGGTVTLRDATFMFGSGGYPTPGVTTYLRKTFTGTVYFPSVGLSATGTVVDEHTVQLTTNPLALPNGSTQVHVNWVMTGSGPAGSTDGGIKQLGFRVSSNGDVVSSSSYNTFADEPREDSYVPDTLTAKAPRRQELFRKNGSYLVSAISLLSGAPYYSPNLDFSGHRALLTSVAGQNAPSDYILDGYEEGGRYISNVGFQGIAPGEPLFSDYRNRTEAPNVAVAWGENLFGFSTHITYTGTKEIRFYRQSFGPYNNGLKDIKLTNNRPASQLASPGYAYQGVSVLSREWVHTRHGYPVAATHRFATDGFRNMWAYPHISSVDILSAEVGPPGVRSPNFNLRYLYTDALGRNPICADGVIPLTTDSSVDFGYDAIFSGETVRKYDTGVSSNPGWFGTGPKTIWNGSQYVVAWVESSNTLYSPVVCLAYAPGSEDALCQTTELGAPPGSLAIPGIKDYTNLVRAQAVATLTTARPTSTSQYAVLDIAYSGSTYAVLWVEGLNSESGQSRSSILGVTIFDQLAPGKSYTTPGLDHDAQTVTSGVGTVTGTVENNSFTITRDVTFGATGYFDHTAWGVQKGDIVVITDSVYGDATSKLAGAYVVLAATATTITVDRNLPSASVPFVFTVKRPLAPAGGKTYVLGSTVMGAYGLDRWRPYRNPKVVWDGHQYQALWVGDSGGSGGGLGDNAIYPVDVLRDQLYTLAIPEHGLASGEHTKFAGSSGLYADPYGGDNIYGLGVLVPNQVSAQVELYLALTKKRVDVGSPDTVSGAGTLANLTLTRSAAGFLTKGVRPGDVVFVANATNTGYDYCGTVQSVVSETALTASTSKGGFISAFAGRNFFILKRGPIPKVKIGDFVRTYAATYEQTPTLYYPNANGLNRISNINVPEGLISVTGVLNLPGTLAYPWDDLPSLQGEVISPSTVDGNYPIDQYGGDDPTYFFNNLSVNGRGLNLPADMDPYVVLAFTYNDKDDEYAVLWVGRSRLDFETQFGFFVSFFSSGMARHIATEQLYRPTGAGVSPLISRRPLVGDIAWNGSEYLVMYPIPDDVAVAADQNIVYHTIRNRVASEQASAGTLTTFLYRGGHPLADTRYTQFATSSKDLYPSFAGVQVLWNPRLSRWVSSVSVCWYPYVNIPDLNGDRFAAFETLPNTVITSIGTGSSSNLINVNSGADLSYIQPGVRLVVLNSVDLISADDDVRATMLVESVSGTQIRVSCDADSMDDLTFSGYLSRSGTGTVTGTNTLTDASAPDFTALVREGDKVLIDTTVHTVTSVGAGSPGNFTFTPAKANGTYSYSVSKRLAVLPREDVFCVTLGSRFPTIGIEDADGVTIENVSVAGATTIEEKYPQMARPIWQSGGMVVGNWSGPHRENINIVNAEDDNILAVHKPSGYNHRYLVPWGKVHLPKYSNVKQSGRNKLDTETLGWLNNRLGSNRLRKG